MKTSSIRHAITSAALGFSLAIPAFAADALKLDVYNPGTEGVFPVSSVLVTGKSEAILIDAQFGKSQAEKVLAMIRSSGKNLSTIYVSHGDPDYYFGLDTILAAYPNAKVVATATTVAHIKQTVAGKLAFWGPKLGDDAPKKAIIPEVLDGHSLTLEGKKLEILGLNGKLSERSFVWIPSIKAVVGGVVLFNNMQVWMADTQTAQSHTEWQTTLAQIARLKPKTVVPGHYLPGSAPQDAVKYTANYIKQFDAETPKAKDSAALIAAMKQHYPHAGADSILELSAKVAKGEMKW